MEDRARRVKSLLEGYYGHGGPIDGGAGGGYATSSGRDDINSRNFDADAHVTSLIREAKLEDLLHKHVSWAAEIKNLDSDMQMLVYENYSKFISATDTIRRMKNNVSSMEDSMDKLLETVTAVQQKSGSINSSLSDRRERIEQLNGTRNLLRKAQYILDLPKRLRALAKAQNYGAAVKSYTGSLPVLQAYGTTSFQQCKVEAEEVMADITAQLQAQVAMQDLPVEQQAVAVELLQQLGHEVDPLIDAFIASHLERLKQQLRRAAEEAAESAGVGLTTTSSHTLVEALRRDFIEDFERTASAFNTIFPTGRGKLTAATKELFGEYISRVQATMQPGSGTSSATSDFVFALRKLSRDVSTMSELVPDAQLAERAGEAMAAAVREHILSTFSLHFNHITASLQAAASRPSSSSSSSKPGSEGFFAAALEEAQAAALTGSLRLLEEMHGLLDDELDLLSPWNEEFLTLVQMQFQTLFLSLHSHFVLLFSSSPPSSPPSPEFFTNSALPPGTGLSFPALALLLARLALFLQQSAIPKIASVLASQFERRNARLDDESGPIFLEAQLFDNFKQASDMLLQQFVDLEARRLHQMVAKSMATPNWLRYKEPRDVRIVVDLIIQEIQSAADVVDQLLDTSADRSSSSSYFGRSSRATIAALAPRQRGSGGSSGGSSGGTRGASRASSRVLERDVAKLFKQKVEIFCKLEFTQSSIMATIVKLTLKSFQECVRLKTFGRHGYQQIQLDALFLCESLRAFVSPEDEAAVDALMDEVASAAAERSLDATSMDAVVMDRIMQAKRDKSFV